MVFRCYSIDISSTIHVYAHGILSFTVSTFWSVLENKFEEYFVRILAIKRFPSCNKNIYFILEVYSDSVKFDSF